MPLSSSAVQTFLAQLEAISLELQSTEDSERQQALLKRFRLMLDGADALILKDAPKLKDIRSRVDPL